MKKINRIAIVLVAMIFMNCNLNNKNIEVSNFVKKYIHLYINDDLNAYLSPNNYIIKVIIEDNKRGYYIRIIGYEKALLTPSDSLYFGCYVFDKYDVLFYGNQYSEFAIGECKCKDINKKLRFNKNEEVSNIDYDPVEFRISLLKNLEFDKMHSFKGNINMKVDDFANIVNEFLEKKYSIVVDSGKDEIYSNVQQTAHFETGVDSLLSIIYRNPLFKKVTALNFTNPKVIIRFIVTKEGDVKEPIIIRGSGNEEIDKVIMDIIKNFPKFQPAKHRNEIVNSYLTIPIKLSCKK